jgi:hypothetical protein
MRFVFETRFRSSHRLTAQFTIGRRPALLQAERRRTICNRMEQPGGLFRAGSGEDTAVHRLASARFDLV